VAPATLGTYTLLATDPATGATASAVLTVDRPSPISLKPAKALMSTQASRSFTVVASDSISTFVDWSVIEGTAGGTITPGGFYTAPSTPGVYHVLARTLFDPSISAIAEVTVAAGLVVDPPQATLLTGISLPFGASGPGTASPSVTWSSPDAPGAMNGPTFTAPGKPGTYTIVATSTTDSTLTGKAKAIVKTTDFNGNGQVVLDWGDLAFLADAWGASPAVDPADLNGDGVVDDQDATIFFTRFGGN
jgi:hypothetical protein